MSANIKEINVRDGLGDLKFGMIRDQVRSLIGEPNEIEKDSDPEFGMTEIWHYDKLELSLSFDEENNWKLIDIAVSSPGYEFMGESLIGLDKETLIIKLNSLGLVNLEIESYYDEEDEDEEEEEECFVITSEEFGMTFWIEDDQLTEIQWEPMFIDDCYIYN